ncbi:hypothetical protein BsWGS_11005 [Bradybaena similaris]
MLQLGSLGGRASTDCDNALVNGSPTNVDSLVSPTQRSGQILHQAQEFQGATPFSHEHRIGALVHWRAAQDLQQQQPSAANVVNHSEEDDDDNADEYRPFTPPPPRERLSYTRHQLEMLNGIYEEVRYPNSTQKQLIAKRIGITREQVKIWFQNRRRKDVVTKSGKSKGSSNEDNSLKISENTKERSPQGSSDNNTWTDVVKDANSSNASSEHVGSREGDLKTDAVSVGCIGYDGSDADYHSSNLREINNGDSFSNVNTSQEVTLKTVLSTTSKTAAPLVLSSCSSNLVSPTILRGMIAELNKFDNEYLKLRKGKKKKHKLKPPRHSVSSSGTGKSERLFQHYDMLGPPNKVTPTAFLNTSANKFKHAVDTSAFQSPRENRIPVTTNDSRRWEGFSLNPSVPGMTENPDIVQQKGTPDLVHSSYTSTLPNQSQLSNFLSGRDRVSLPNSSLPSTQSHLYDNLPVLSDLLGNYASHSAGASLAAAVAAAQRQQEHSILSCVSSGQPQPGTNLPGVYFHLPGEGSSNNSASGDSSKSLPGDICFPRSSTLSHPHHQTSTLAMNRVFPFPLVTEPPRMLSSRQSEAFLHHAQWPSSVPSINSQTPTQSSALGIHGNSSATPANLNKDQYRPMMISSITNPYFPTSAPYSLTSSGLASQSPLWTMQPPTDNSNFTQTQL